MCVVLLMHLFCNFFYRFYLADSRCRETHFPMELNRVHCIIVLTVAEVEGVHPEGGAGQTLTRGVLGHGHVAAGPVQAVHLWAAP